MNARLKVSGGNHQHEPAGAEGVSAPDLSGARYLLSPDLVMCNSDRREEAEAIRTVRTHIVARHLDAGRRGLAICAATAGVGCTYTATNLAVALAQVGLSTLLIDGDLRSPQVDEMIRPDPPAIGLKQFHDAGDGHVDTYIHHDVVPNLSVLYSGGRADNAQEILASDLFRRMLNSCLRDYDFTIVDTPPAKGCADALRISNMLGYSLIVARTHVSLTGEVATLAEQIQKDGGQVIGSVLQEFER